jgi:hypothetical protein
MPKDQVRGKCQSGSFKWPIRAVGRMETTGKKPDIKLVRDVVDKLYNGSIGEALRTHVVKNGDVVD